MTDYEPSLYGDRIAEFYDTWYRDQPDTAGTVNRLAELAGAGPVLELGVGTGRIALPLARRGIEVHGIDASQAMVDRLREKPGGDAIIVTIGDFADVAVDGRFSLVFAVFGTFFSLDSQDAQLRCFENVCQHLKQDGLFVIEAFVLDSTRFHHGQAVSVGSIHPDQLVLEAGTIDLAEQRLVAQHVVLTAAGIRLVPISARFAWPSELDLMARIAGLRLRSRAGNWHGDPFTSRSSGHVSVYGLDHVGA